MKIAYNPITAGVLTNAPANNDITFDLRGLNIFVRGVKFKGTDTTYSVFKKHTSSGGGYNGLVPVPSYTSTNVRFLREDGTWQVPSNQYTYSSLTNQDLDTLKTEGKWYYLSGSNKVTNGPSDISKGGELYVGRNASGYRYQKVILYNGLIWFRIWDNSSWSDWKRWYTDANTDSKVLQSNTTTTNYRPIILGYNNNADHNDISTSVTQQVYTTTSIYAQPSTGSLWATKLYSGGKLVVTDVSNYVTLNTAQTITGQKTFTSQINSSLNTTTYLEGNKGKAIINSTAGAGQYVMLFKGNSTNGYFTHGVYQGKYLLQYTVKSTVDAGTNAVTKSVTLLDESGNMTAPKFIGSLQGNADSATKLTTSAGSATRPIYFSDGKPVAGTYTFGNASGNAAINNGTVNSNLNADLLDGKHLSDLVPLKSQYFWISTDTRPYNYIYLCRIANTKAYSTLRLNLSLKSRYSQSDLYIAIECGQATSTTVHIRKCNTNISPANLYYKTITEGSYVYVDLYTDCWAWNQVGYVLTNVGVNGILSHTPKGTLIDSLPSGYVTIGDIEYKVNVNSATKLQTARQINGTNFDGTANITTSYWGTARTLTIGNSAKPVNGSGNVSWSLSEIGAAAASHTHGLLHDNFTVLLADTTTDSGWSMINSSYNGFILKSIRMSYFAPSWILGDYAAGICFGGGDTKGVISMAYNSPNVRFAGGNGSKPVWHFSLSGVNGVSYNLDNLISKYLSEVNYITDLDSPSWFNDGNSYGISLNSYNIAAANQPGGGDNANSVLNICNTKHGTSGVYGWQIAFENHDIFARKWGAGFKTRWYKIWHSGDFAPTGSKTQPVVLFSGRIYRSGSSWYVDSSRSSQISGTGTLTVSITSARMTITLPSAKITSASIHICDSTKVSGASTTNTSGRSEGPFWFSVYANIANYIYVRPFCQGNADNDQWLSQNNAWTAFINSLTVTLFGYV